MADTRQLSPRITQTEAAEPVREATAPEARQLPPRFTQSEAAELIREATSHMLATGEERQLTKEELVAMARELGVSESALEQALVTRARRQQQERRWRYARLGLAAHGASYALVTGGLVLIDYMSGPNWWVQWPALGWGMGLAFHTLGMSLARLFKSPGK